MVLERHNLQSSDDVIACFAQMFEVCPAGFASPAKFSIFVDNYVNIFNAKRVTVESRLNRLRAGVGKLTEAREAVATMQKKAAKKSKLLAEKQAEADMALKAITQSMTGANEQKADMEQLKIATEKENERIEQQKKIIDEQLREVEPMLNEAREAVGSIKSESLSEIRSLRAPPEAIRDILQAVLLFMGILDTSWEAMRKFLARSGVKEEIINFDARRITPEVSKKVTTLMRSKAASFDPKNAKRASIAAAPLAAWVHANLQYSSILEKISPLEQEKNELLRNLSKAEKQVAKLSRGLRTVDEKVADLKANFEILMKDATQIKIDLDKEQATIQVAGTLIERLGGEFERWQQQMNTLQKELDQLERCSVLTAAFVTFLGSASEQLRRTTMDDWRKLTNIDKFNALQFASMETEQLNWKNKGLPSDILSVENAMIIFNSVQIPLLIDPSGRVSSFLENYLKESKVEKLNAAQPDFITQVELGVRFGKSLIVDDVVYIEPALMKLLRMELSNQGPRHVVQIGGKSVDYNNDFRIFFCTKNGQIDLPRSIKSAITEVNFTTTRSGLASQMLSFAIKIEKPELENRSSELTRNVEEMKMKLDELEQILLQALASSEGSLLDNTQLLDSLNKSKENAETISSSLHEADKLQEELNKQRDVYLSLAQYASTLYFAINELHRHNHMYDFSVTAVINLFMKTLINDKNKSNSIVRFDELKKVLQNAVFEYVSRSLFKEDRLMFSMNFVHATQANLFLKNEWEIFTGLIVDEPREDPSIKITAWIDAERRTAVAKLMTHLPTLYNNLRLDDQGTWSEFSRSTNCEAAFPQAIEPLITLFQKVIVIQAVRPDRLHSAMTLFVTKALGISSINPPPLDLKSLFRNESNELEPILIMTGAGADPSQDLEELAKNEIGSNRFYAISMGQGQQQNAVDTLRRAAENGDWVCLKNLHLVIASLPAIQKELSLLQRHSNFRLWLTSEPDDKFPSVLLQESIKLTFESPPGVKNNMNRTYTQWRDSGVSGGVFRQQCLFILAWIHALIQERRIFIPQAWSKFYEFNNADLRAAKLIIEEMTNVDTREPEWEFIRGLMQYVIYGGRIDSTFDFNVLNGYLLRYFNSSMISTSGVELAKNIPIPASNKFTDYVMAIEKIPAEDVPSLFGLPDNIRISWEVTESEATIRQIRNMQIGSSVDVTFEWMRWQNSLNPILNMWKRLNAHSTLHSMSLPHASNSDDPIIEVLSLEFVFAVALVQTVHRSLSTISKCLRGVLLPSSSTMKLAQSLILHETPDAWQDVWTGPSDPAQYLTSLMFKAKATQELMTIAKNGQLLPSAVKLSKLFRPGTLLNAFRQLTARRKKKSMDELKLATAWNPALLKDEIIMQLSGIYIQGALFESTLSDTFASSPPFSSVPKLSVAWISAESSDVYKSSESIFVPMYADVNREQLITQVQIPCGKDTQKWQIASVALFLSSH